MIFLLGPSQNMKALAKVDSPRGRVHDILFRSIEEEETLFVACEDGIVRVYDLAKADGSSEEEEEGGQGLDCVMELRGHAKRYVFAFRCARWQRD